MDAFSDPLIEEVIVMTSSQVGKTEIINNVIGYYMDQDPAPILQVQPTLDIAKAYSKDRLAPMLRDTPVLKHKVGDPKTRFSDNTTLHKVFVGGHITIAGANSPASLSARPIRLVLQDEIDRFPFSAGTEGDPCDLSDKRSTTFWNRKLGKFSTPTVAGQSKIEKRYNESDMRKFYVPCPECDEYQIMAFKQLKWEKDKEGMPKNVYYECKFCRAELSDNDKLQMVKRGEWRAHRTARGIAGYWLNELYSCWVSFQNLAERWVRANKKGREALQVFVNTALAEVYQEGEGKFDDSDLMARREPYGLEVPANALLLTAGVDIQIDRIEVEVIASGVDDETWSMEKKFFIGDPVRQQVWKDLDDYLITLWKHQSGVPMVIAGVGLDTGYLTRQCYVFVKERQNRRVYGRRQRVFAVKGSNEPLKAFLNRPSRTNFEKINLYNLGVNNAKDTIYSRLSISEAGAGYMHFPMRYEKDYFEQLTSEVRKKKKGVRIWELIKGRKNEALDCRVYAMGALGLLNPNWNKLIETMQKKIADYKEKKLNNVSDEENLPVPVKKKPIQRQRRRAGYMNRWRK